jgi:hypothetical protein
MSERKAGTDWFAVEVVADQVIQAKQYVAELSGRNYVEYVSRYLSGPKPWPHIESPLEAIFFAWYFAVNKDTDQFYCDDFGLKMQHEVEVGGALYRLDFIIVPNDGPVKKLAALGREAPKIGIEVDGHAFHEKTAEQVTYRNRRDRALQQGGWTILHYSWPELTREPIRCLTEVLTVASAAYSKVDFDYWGLIYPIRKADDVGADPQS